MNGCLIDSAGRLESCFNTVEVWLLRFWEARNDSLAINSKSMEGSLVLALMLDEASSPVHSRALDGRQTYIFLVAGGLRRTSPGISEWENMDELENSTVTWNSMVTSVENYTAMKWPVDCLHYTRMPFNYNI
ncbi:unnamed protein product [Brassica oleracea]|uniref:(rape) hypothetical protein n=1 Tax=Brassica napus TaxID=3708 RepID=A0A816IFY6_BRANA|nr:unnamed protein product [Brassica napus]